MTNLPCPRPWICAQIGSREHYAIPRALHERNHLRLFLTDFWAKGEGLWNLLPAPRRKKVEERYDLSLANANVVAPGDARLFFDLRQRILRRGSWDTTIRRNEWFQQTMLRRLRGPYRHIAGREPPGTFFSYSYAAKEMLRFFRGKGWRTILGQIDPGPREEEIVANETSREMEFSSAWGRAPSIYWERWREECDLADEIWVNSAWSAEALTAEGIADEKIRIVPLVYSQPSAGPRSAPKEYPDSFSEKRPMRVLFLGQINLRKGAHLLLRASRMLAGEPVEFWMVGPSEIRVPEEFLQSSRFRWTGPVSRAETIGFYRDADLFILPTLSDGFALTQLEAQARQLPLLASRFCGKVVRDGENGLLLDPLNEETIAEKLRYCLRHPDALVEFSRQSGIAEEFQPSALTVFINSPRLKRTNNEQSTTVNFPPKSGGHHPISPSL